MGLDKEQDKGNQLDEDMLKIERYVEDFLKLIAADHAEIYNEFSLQHELGIYLRENIKDHKVQFERNVYFFGEDYKGYKKKEIDISIYSPDMKDKYAIELKCPMNGQYPEQMFSCCLDIYFLEQLIGHGNFKKGYFLILVNDNLFYEGRDTSGIYSYFRAGKKLQGLIEKPTGGQKYSIKLGNSYDIIWNALGKDRKYALITVNP